MKVLFSIGKYATKGYRSVCWAGKGFVYRGLWIWNGKKNVRIIPFNRFFEKAC
jgi:hypothetical protein